MMEKESALNIS